MARNKFAGYCYHCGKYVAAGEGYFERHFGHWRVQCISCCFKYREEKRKTMFNKAVGK